MVNVEVRINGTILGLVEGDITTLDTDAIVNAANGHLIHGGGIAAAISRRGGPDVQRESARWVREHGPVATGATAMTSGGALAARHIIHAVGPVYDRAAISAPLLASAVRAALQMADDHNLTSIALPAISTGIFGYPLEEAARVMLQTTIDYLRAGTGLERVLYCLFGSHASEVFARELAEIAVGADGPG